MRRLVFVGWCVASLGVWLLIALLMTRFAYAHMYFEIPNWFKGAVRWIVHLFAPNYDPDSLDMEDACVLVLVLVAHLLSAVIVVPASRFAWRHVVRIS
jgi:hypothetical protein